MTPWFSISKCQFALKSPTLTLKSCQMATSNLCNLKYHEVFVVKKLKLHCKQHQATLNDRAKSYSPCRLGCYLCVMASDQIDKKCHIMLVLSGPSLSLLSKLYIPSTINIWKKVLTKAIWADKNLAGFWQISLYIK